MKITFEVPAPLGLWVTAFSALGAVFPAATLGTDGTVVVDDTSFVPTASDYPTLVEAITEAIDTAIEELHSDDHLYQAAEFVVTDWDAIVQRAAEMAVWVFVAGIANKQPEFFQRGVV